MDIGKVRDVVYEHSFDDDMGRLCADFWRAEEAFRAVEWLLARFPMVGKRKSPWSQVRVYTTHEIDGFPPVAIYYTYTSTHVYLLAIRTSPHHGNGDEEHAD